MTPASTAALQGVSAVVGDSDPEQLTLGQAERRALSSNRDLLDARRRVQSAEADGLIARAGPNPNLNLGFDDYQPRTGIGPGSPRNKLLTTQIGVDQLVERGGKRALRMRVADFLLQATRLDQQDTARQQLLMVRAAYYDLLLAQDTVAIVTQTAQLYDETSAAAQRRLKAGDIPATDASRVEVDRLRAQSDLQNAIQARSDARLALAGLLALEPQAGRLRAVDDWPAVGITGPIQALLTDPDALAQTLDARADVRAARTRIEAAQAGRDLARSLRTRDIVIGGWYKRNATGARAEPPYVENALGLTVSVPLQINNRYDGEIAHAESDFGSAQDALARTIGVAQNEIQHAATSLETAHQRSERYAREILPGATRNAEAYEFAFRRGALDVTDLLDARRTLRATQLEALDARADYAKAAVAWLAATAPADRDGLAEPPR